MFALITLQVPPLLRVPSRYLPPSLRVPSRYLPPSSISSQSPLLCSPRRQLWDTVGGAGQRGDWSLGRQPQDCSYRGEVESRNQVMVAHRYFPVFVSTALMFAVFASFCFHCLDIAVYPVLILRPRDGWTPLNLSLPYHYQLPWLGSERSYGSEIL